VRSVVVQVVMKVGSYAMGTHEPRQVREEAAVSGHFRVPWGSLAGANYTIALGAGCRRRVHGYRILIVCLTRTHLINRTVAFVAAVLVSVTVFMR
jgi:hypothetical protein